MKAYVVHVLLPRQGGYSKWTQSVPLPKALAEAEHADFVAKGYKTRIEPVTVAAGHQFPKIGDRE